MGSSTSTRSSDGEDTKFEEAAAAAFERWYGDQWDKESADIRIEWRQMLRQFQADIESSDQEDT